jgi:hypothetical protein
LCPSASTTLVMTHVLVVAASGREASKTVEQK